MNRTSTRARLLQALAVSLVGVVTSEAQAQSSGDSHAASEARFERGTELFRHHEYPQALVEFQAAADLLRTPNILLAMGLCLGRMGQQGSAYNAFTEASALAVSLSDPRYGDTARRAEHEASTLEPHLARLDLHVDHPPEGLTVRVEGESAPPSNWNRPVAYSVGDVTVSASATGFHEFHQTVHLSEGQQVDVTLSLDADAAPSLPPEPVVVPTVPLVPDAPSPENTDTTDANAHSSPGHGLRVAGWITGSVGLVGLAGFAIFGAMASSRFNSLASSCHMGPCPSADNSEINTGVTWQTTANVSLGVGAGLVGVGAVLLLIGATRHEDDSAPTEVAPHLDAWIDPAHGSLGVRGAF